MNKFAYYETVERFHTFQNPTSVDKLDRLIAYCGIEGLGRGGAAPRVLDVGCGKAWLLRRIAERHAIEAVGVEIHRGFLDVGRREAGDAITFHEVDAKDYHAEPASFDLAFCIGASFAVGAFEDMVTWLRELVRPGGVMAIGDVYARHRDIPPQSAFAFSGGRVRSFVETCAALDRDGLHLTGVIDSSTDDWDRYESLHWHAAQAWLVENPEHPERDAFKARYEAEKRLYLEFDRAALGWAMFVCRLD